MFRSSLYSHTTDPNIIINHLRYNLFNIKYFKNSIEIFESDKNKVYHCEKNKEMIFLLKNHSKTKDLNLIELEKCKYEVNNLNINEFIKETNLKKIKNTEKCGVILEINKIFVEVF